MLSKAKWHKSGWPEKPLPTSSRVRYSRVHRSVSLVALFSPAIPDVVLLSSSLTGSISQTLCTLLVLITITEGFLNTRIEGSHVLSSSPGLFVKSPGRFVGDAQSEQRSGTNTQMAFIKTPQHCHHYEDLPQPQSIRRGDEPMHPHGP